MLTSTYVEGSSLLHRMSPGVKLLGLVAVTSVVVLVPSLWVLGAAAVTLVVLGVGFGPGWKVLGAHVWALRWIVLVLTPLQVWTAGWERAVLVVGSLVVAIVAAGLVTVTTRVADMMDTVIRVLRPLERFGIDADRVGLAMALAIRAVPVLGTTLHECGEARRARGLERSPRALLVPFVVRSVRYAERMGEALIARGLDD